MAMADQLQVSVGQYSDRGRKEINQDFHGAYLPGEPLLSNKGVAIALADGISSSDVSQVASEMAVRSFLDDYFCTTETWSVKKSAWKVLTASNSWLFAQTQKNGYSFDRDRGYVCTLSAMVFKSTTAHMFHIGDSRIYRLRNNALEQLSNDHRLWVSQEKSYLNRAMGINPQIEIEYTSYPLARGDIFVFATDGVYEYVDENAIVNTIQQYAHDLDTAAKAIAGEAYANQSDDNLTIQILRVEQLPTGESSEIYQQLTDLPFPPELQARMVFDGYRIIRKLHASSRSHVYLAVDEETDTRVVLKTPSIDLRDDAAYLERFLMEEWVARRINSAHVLKPCPVARKRNFIYVATEFIEGQTLAQWMLDNPHPDLHTVRGIIDQVARGLYAFHRLEMLHQDLRPNNIMLDITGTAKIIDFGSTKVAGIAEITTPIEQQNLLGTAQYTAPEYFLGEPGTPQSDLFSLGVIAYQMLTGNLPYGTQVAKIKTRGAQRKLKYRSALDEERDIPAWVDVALKKAVHPDPHQRYAQLSEFLYDLRQPGKAFENKTRAPLIARSPLVFWQSVSLLLALAVAYLSITLYGS
jgi:serine/threonine protein phosphatase PrpC